MALYHTPEEEAALRTLSTKDLAKLNNRKLNEALVFSDPVDVDKHLECQAIVRDELVVRGILSDVDERRLIDGKELPNE